MNNKRRTKTRDWLNKQNRDPYVQKARKQGYRGRAAYKLQEMDQKHQILKPGMSVVDLGAAPGSWCQYAVSRLKLGTPNARGQLIAIDLLEMPPIDSVTIIQGDFTSGDALAAIDRATNSTCERPFDVVLSDMAPNITGIAMQDQGRYERLLEAVLAFCQARLKPGGSLLSKFFEGESAQHLRQQFKKEFSMLKSVKPDASRAQSREQYLLAKGKR